MKAIELWDEPMKANFGNHLARRGVRPPRVMTVTSGKGGVGKSNIVANLGLALARQGRKVLLIDADLGLANLHILLGVKPRYSLHDVLQLRNSLAEALVDGPEGLKILPASSGIAELADLDHFQKLFILDELDHYGESLDVVLIDTGAGISKNVLFFNIAAAERIVVANDQPTSLTDAYALIKVLATQHVQKHFRLLVNGISHPRLGEVVYRTLARVTIEFLGPEVHLDYLGAIVHDEAVPRAIMKRQPVLALFPESPASQSFEKLARQLWESDADEGLDGNVKFFWRRFLQGPRRETRTSRVRCDAGGSR